MPKSRGIQVHSEAVDEVEAGHRTAINLQGVDVADIERGMVLAPPGTLQPNYMLDCQLLYLASNAKPLKHRARVRVHLGTAEIIGGYRFLTETNCNRVMRPLFSCCLKIRLLYGQEIVM